MTMPKAFDEKVLALLKELADECHSAGVSRHNIMITVQGCQVNFDITPEIVFKRTEA